MRYLVKLAVHTNKKHKDNYTTFFKKNIVLTFQTHDPGH
jgi:hypothetical protein